MSKKSAKIAALIESCGGGPHDPSSVAALGKMDARYGGYFECFNRGLFYESHDVLEDLWLADRHGPNGAFYKGLIQFAGAFVHLSKHTSQRPRLRPAAALFKLAQANLHLYPATHEHLEVNRLLVLIDDWLVRLEAGHFEVNPLTAHNAPKLQLNA